MDQQNLLGFEDPEDLTGLQSQASRLVPKLKAMSDEGIYFGTSSWKYEGWLGTIYSPELYQTRNKFSQAKFDNECLSEYARIFPVVCGDFAFYQFPTTDFWKKLFGGSPEKLRFSFKVPEDITAVKWPSHARYGKRAGEMNESFLDATVFDSLFLDRLRPYASRVAPMILEFGTIAKSLMPDVNAFLDRLDPFLAQLPAEFRYSIETRNPEYLSPAYFDVLSRHKVAHVFNAWTRMPSLDDQAQLEDAFTTDFTIIRALLPKGRAYEQAVKALEPYEAIKEPYPSARTGIQQIVEKSKRKHWPAYVYVNNRLEGHAPTTIESIIDAIPT
jgi:uncharacterized protein YecE (DUF72 family)